MTVITLLQGRIDHSCPRCDSSSIARSRTRGVWGRTMKLIGVRAYRCMNCWYRFRALDRTL